MLFQKSDAIIIAANPTNAGNHGEKMAQQNAQFGRLFWSDVKKAEKNIGEKWLDFVQKCQYFIIKMTVNE